MLPYHTVGGFLGLVGPLNTAVTQLISLSSQIPAVSNWKAGGSTAGAPNNIVNIGVGLFEGGSETDFGGDGLNINAFTGQGTPIGSGKAPHMNQGQTYGISIDASKSEIGNVQAWQLTLSASGADAVCVQFVELAWMGTLTSGFDGTWGKDCGQDWYWSESTWGTIEQPDPSNANNSVAVPYRPACWWMDNVSKEHKTQIHPNREVWVNMELVIAGAPVVGSNASTQTFCNDQVMKFSSKTVDHNSNAVPDGLNSDRLGSGPPGAASPPPPVRKRANPHFSTRKRTPDTGTLESSNGTTQTRLIVSEVETHSAQELCNHLQSRGPDFVSKGEKLFCDMSSRQTYPLCEGTVTTNCFALDPAGKRIRKRGDDETGKGDTVHRDYNAIDRWTA